MALSTIDTSSISGLGYGFKNRIINGGMQVWQRGTSFSASGSGYYTADRWQTLGQTGTYAQSTDAPTGFKYSTSVTSLSANYGTFCQRIESQNILDLAGQSVTISFWAKATSGGASGLVLSLDYATAVDNFSTTTYFAGTTTAALTSTWTKYTYTISSLNSNAANGLQLYIYNAAGGSAAITYLITGVQLEAGTVATSFDWRPYGTELALCQRYYWQIGPGYAYLNLGNFTYEGAGNAQCVRTPPVTMRVLPTYSKTGNLLANYGTLGSISVDINQSAPNSLNLSIAGGSGGTNGFSTYVRANNDNTVSYKLDAEL